MQQSLARAAFAAAFLAVMHAPAGAEEPVTLHPCPSLLRLGAMDESGTITRPTSHSELAAAMTRLCDYVVLGRFVSVADRHYDNLMDPFDEPVISTFQVSEVLWGEPVTVAAIGVERGLLVAPDGEVSRFASSVEVTTDLLYRRRLATEMEHELTLSRDSGKPLTLDRYERLVDALERLVEVPPRTSYELHERVDGYIATNSPLDIYRELGAIRPDEVYLLGLNDENTTGSPRMSHFNSLHTYFC